MEILTRAGVAVSRTEGRTLTFAVATTYNPEETVAFLSGTACYDSRNFVHVDDN
jgi:hypothetical protein